MHEKCLQLVDMTWKLGIAVCSDECKSLNSPFVTMTLKVADASGKVSTHTFELSLTQFQVYVKFVLGFNSICHIYRNFENHPLHR